MAEPQMPGESGVVSGSPVTPERPPPTEELQLSQNETWGTVSREWTFFTPALLMLCTPPMKVHPLQAVAEVLGRYPVVKFVESQTPIFNGLMSADADVSFNHSLLLMSHEDWKASQAVLGTLAWNDAQKGIFRRLRFQELHVLDQILWQQTKIAGAYPMVPVTAWVVETNRGSFYFKAPSDQDTLRRPVAHFDASCVFPDTVKFAAALQQGSSDPYNSLQIGKPLHGH